MAAVIEIHDMQCGYLEIVRHVLSSGRPVSPRLQATIEDLNVIIVHNDPSDSLPVNVGRSLSRPLAALEALQLIGGISDPRLMEKVAPVMRRFMDGSILAGAYGPRVGVQLDRIVEKLKQDKDTRQAVVTIWDPLHDHFLNPPHKDVPCTIMQQFLLRRNKLIMHTTMRSNDVYLGVAYDIFAFTQLQLAIATALGVEVGQYYHHAVSLHAYTRDIPALEELTPPTAPAERVKSLGEPGDTWQQISLRARQIIYGATWDVPTPSIGWHQAQAKTWQ